MTTAKDDGGEGGGGGWENLLEFFQVWGMTRFLAGEADSYICIIHIQI